MQHLLIITNSYDVTTDLLLERLRGEAVFRFNFDRFPHYQLLWNRNGFLLTDEVGRQVSSDSVRKAYWRKPFHAPLTGDYTCTEFVTAEMRYALSELVNLLWLDRKFVLVEPFAEKRTGKLIQLRYAESYFEVPDYEFLVNRTAKRTSGVVKSLSNERVGDGVLFTTRVKTASLQANYPWFVQEEVPAPQDVTVVFLREQLHAFCLQRDFLEQSVDWRQVVSPTQQWSRHQLPAQVEEAIRRYMRVLRLDYGRLDFLLDTQGRYWFCEVNPNGQFAWLDRDGEDTLLSCVAAEISPATPVYPLPNRHGLERNC